MKLKSRLRALAPRSVRVHRILRGPLRGKKIVTSLHDYPGAILGTTERALLDWMQANVHVGEIWLDIGAHYGYTTIALAGLVGMKGTVFAFEPSPKTAGHLSETCTLNGLTQVCVIPLALGDSGPIRLASVCVDRGMVNHGLGGDRTEKICIVGFDLLWPGLGTDKVDGIKIDVQGMESEVLAGMSQALREQKPKLVVEFHAGVDRSSILNRLKVAGYRLPATPLDPLPDESVARYFDNRSYAFVPS